MCSPSDDEVVNISPQTQLFVPAIPWTLTEYAHQWWAEHHDTIEEIEYYCLGPTGVPESRNYWSFAVGPIPDSLRGTGPALAVYVVRVPSRSPKAFLFVADSLAGSGFTATSLRGLIMTLNNVPIHLTSCQDDTFLSACDEVADDRGDWSDSCAMCAVSDANVEPLEPGGLQGF